MPIRTRPLVLFLATALVACGCASEPYVTQAPVAPACAPGTAWDGSRCVAFRTAPVAVDQRPIGMDGDEAGEEIAKHAVLAPSLDPAIFRDDRRMRPRARALLVVEIQQLESLFQATSVAARDRPLLLRRLAEDYVELEKAAGNGPPIVDRARREAIKYYATLLTEYSGQPSQTFPASPPPAYPQLDEATYYLAYEHEQAGDEANARRVYFELISKLPNSRFIPRAYLAFGELFAVEAMSDPSKWDLAKQAYTKVVSTPPPANEAYGYAWYRLAYVLMNQGDAARARDAFQKTVDFAASFPQLPGSGTLGAAAQEQLRSLSP
jgi:tetratricopeptide (TPR) repeat protein